MHIYLTVYSTVFQAFIFDLCQGAKPSKLIKMTRLWDAFELLFAKKVMASYGTLSKAQIVVCTFLFG